MDEMDSKMAAAIIGGDRQLHRSASDQVSGLTESQAHELAHFQESYTEEELSKNFERNGSNRIHNLNTCHLPTHEPATTGLTEAR